MELLLAEWVLHRRTTKAKSLRYKATRRFRHADDSLRISRGELIALDVALRGTARTSVNGNLGHLRELMGCDVDRLLQPHISTMTFLIPMCELHVYDPYYDMTLGKSSFPRN